MPSPRALFAKILRFPLSLIPDKTVVRILRGPLKGRKWIKGAGPNAYWIGTYEVARLSDFANAVVEGAVVYDVGANVGIYSLLASLRTGPSGMVYSFEPLDRNLSYLRRHLQLNDTQNCVALETAVCNEEGTRRFSADGWTASMARISPGGEILVASTSLDNCVYGDRKIRPPDVIKIDVEGAEVEVLHGATRVLSEFHPTIFLELHGAQLHDQCRDFLKGKGYYVEDAYGQLTATWRWAK